MNNRAQKRNLTILLIILAIILGSIITYSIVQFIMHAGKAKVTVQYAPFTATVDLDGTQLKNNDINYIPLGDHTVTVSLDGFDTLTQNVTITNDTTNIYGMMQANSELGERITREQQTDFLTVQALYGKVSLNTGTQERSEWPLLNHLPINNMLFSIGYTIENNSTLLIFIDASSTYLNDAVNALMSLDFSQKPLYSYNISYKKWQNPLTNQFVNNAKSNPTEFLQTGYASISQSYNLIIHDGTYSDDDQYYYTILTTGAEDRYNLVTYRCVLRKNGSSWILAGTPTPILTTYNTPNIPNNILEAANSN